MRFYEDLEIGWTARVGRYVMSESEIVEFGTRWDPRPFHVDAEQGRQSHFGGLVASGTHVFCVRSWLSNRLDPPIALVAGLGLDRMEILAPVRPGDELELALECVGRRRSRSRPERGILQIRNTILNQREEAVMRLTAELMVEVREANAPA